VFARVSHDCLEGVTFDGVFNRFVFLYIDAVNAEIDRVAAIVKGQANFDSFVVNWVGCGSEVERLFQVISTKSVDKVEKAVQQRK
jgi:hypothetical protein